MEMLASITEWLVRKLGRTLDGKATPTGRIHSAKAKPHFGEFDDNLRDFLAFLGVFLSPSATTTYKQVSLIAFDPHTEVTIKDSKGNECKISEGMPPVIFQLSSITGEDLVKAQSVVDDYTAKGFQTLAAARTDDGGKWVMLDVVPMLDAPRPSSSN